MATILQAEQPSESLEWMCENLTPMGEARATALALPASATASTSTVRCTNSTGGVELCNGIGLSPDEDRLYHSDSTARCIWLHDLDPSGELHDRRVFATLDSGAPDGLAVDCEGGVWVADVSGGCVQRFTPDGRFERKLEFPSDFVTSLCFGGEDGRDLYVVTASNLERPDHGGTIFRARSEFAGLPAPLARV